MTTFQDGQAGLAKETVYGTPVTPVRFPYIVDETLDFTKNIVESESLRVGSRAARSSGRVATTADAGGEITMECISKGMGLIWEQCMGAGVSTLVSAGVYQQNFTLADVMPSATWQVGAPRFDGVVDPYTYVGGMVESWELEFDQAAIAMLKMTLDAKDVTTATALATPSQAEEGTANLFHFANATISTGTFTAPTATTLAAGATPLANVRSGTISVNHNLGTERQNFGGGGRKAKPNTGTREVTGSLTVEYDSTAFRDAVLNDSTRMSLVLTYTAGPLTTGFETLQVALPLVAFNGQLPSLNGGDEILIDLDFKAYETPSTPVIYVCTRTADAAL